MTRLTTPFGPRASADDVLAGVDLTGRRYLVTGGASGIGAETVRALARAGAQVVVATRAPGAAETLVEEFPQVSAVALDLADPASVHALTAAWTGRLDAVVANAGVMALPTRQLSAQGWELQLATNFLGHLQLVTGLHAPLAASGGRIVTVSSGAQRVNGVDLDDLQFARRPYDPWTAYAQSKTATALLAVAVSRRWAADGITANSLEPGFIHTNLQRHLDADAMRSFGAMDEAGELVTPEYYKTPAQGAATSVLLAASPLVEGVSGRYFQDNQEAEVVDGGAGTTSGVARWAVDPDVADRLWDTAQQVG
ncbi:SDR family NAD(P)-dependent oxidoreductase [Kineococcus aurantiacus]|uniref:Probable oxidoreductase n=1 Tax=Kineococcus aurantiacus TaxID=37633 RepID=A0A7Y9DQB9_9ACTN|nr:SDR family NAD(P)-dependent oxidoreductase [Kineococcus aurantiacus]NYD24865.1 NAD(P)-dependent dehydrogenase (short-subunit alcohol dehydrogenase family) [Kineococcus aurantiacus]